VGIPFGGDGDAKVALLGGNVDYLGANLAPVLDQVKGGTMRALGVSSKERLKDLPDVPTFTEAGFPGMMSITGWSGLFGPKGLPKEVTDVWLEVLKKVSADPQWRDVTMSMGNIPVMNTPAEAKEYVRKQVESFKQVFSSN
jgi:tripartite-type tricarboxylate transporter receptor subunit TctC